MTSHCLQIWSIGLIFCFAKALIVTAEDSAIFSKDEYIPLEGPRYDALDWKLLQALGSSDFGNVLISPLSLKLILSMLYEGASGSTKVELENILEVTSSNQSLIREKFQSIIESLSKKSNDFELDLGSRIYMDNSINPQQRFAAMIEKFYNSDIKSVDFGNVLNTKEEINYWVSNVTHGHIRDLVNEGDLQNAILLIANALYFKGIWKSPFQRSDTYDGVFYTNSSHKTSVPFMYTHQSFYYFQSSELDCKILRLPFKQSHISMFILLPSSKDGLDKLIRDISSQELKRQIWLMDIHDVHVHLPKFSFEFNSKLGKILQSLGLNHIFQNTASLAAIARGAGLVKRLMVTDILQKAGINVDEEGSTAYAATEVSLVNKFGIPTAIFNASNPFVFYIEDENTGTVLFVGKVENPRQREQPPFREDLEYPSRFSAEKPQQPEAQGRSTTSQPLAPSTGLR